MTMNELHALYEQYFPSAPPPAQQGRAGVTTHVERNARYDMDRRIPALRTGAPPYEHKPWWYWESTRVCPICGEKFNRRGTRKQYDKDACKQKAYRQRKKAESQIAGK